MRKFNVGSLPTRATQVSTPKTRTYHLPDWSTASHPQRLAIMRKIATSRGRDPRIAEHAVKIIKSAKINPRDYKGQAAALLAWIQNPKNFYYVNEPGERLQDPIYSLKVRHGDCDDAVILLCSLFESIGLPWKQVISGLTQDKQKVRHIEGGELPEAMWTHIYCMVGTHPFHPVEWYFCEPTVQGVPLGWDVIEGDSRYLPEMQIPKGNPRIVGAPSLGGAYSGAFGNVGTSVGSAVAGEMEGKKDSRGINYKEILVAVGTGIAISAGTQLTLDWARGTGVWAGSGTVLDRWNKILVKLRPTPLSLPLKQSIGDQNE